MLFNSLIFLVFAGIFFALWPLVRRRSNFRWGWIFAASMLFYGWWDWSFLLLILFSGLVDFWAGLAMHWWPERKKLFLWVSIVANVGTLCLFKYLGFFMSAFGDIVRLGGVELEVPIVSLALPVGISFYTFQSMSYTIDIYRGNLTPTRSFLHFFAYLSMFPQLVAGPIIRASDLLPQLEDWKPTTEEDRFEGLRLIVSGFFKKMVIADNIAPAVADAFGRDTVVHSTPYWALIVSMTCLQVYCDFGGYSDIARGLARWMGYHFPLNFDRPFCSTSVREFWARWHISLGHWFRDYVYIPLGGPVKGFRGHFNVFATMLISGVWHGAAWTFVWWGILQGLCVSLERLHQLPKRLLKLPWKIGRPIATFLTIIQIWTAFLFFMAQSVPQAVSIMKSLYLPTAWNWRPVELLFTYQKQAMLLFLLFCIHESLHYFGLDRSRGLALLRTPAFRVAALASTIVLCAFFRGPGQSFVYFQF